MKDLRKIRNRGDALRELAKISGSIPAQVKDALKEMGVTDEEFVNAEKAAKASKQSSKKKV